MKIRKNHSRKRYRYNVNRKSLNKTRKSTGKIKDPVMKKIWLEEKCVSKNFNEIGLAKDPNKTVPIPNYKQNRLKVAKIVNGFVEEELDQHELPTPTRGHIADELEQMSKERADPEFRLPKGVIKELSYFLDKYHFDYKAMVSDRRNHNQLTWKQFRMKIRKFMSIPEQFDTYLEKQKLPKGVKPDWPEYESDSEWK